MCIRDRVEVILEPDVDPTEAQRDLMGLITEANATESIVQAVYTCEYLEGTSLRSRSVDRGEVTEYEYDYRHRLISTTVTPREGQSLVRRTNYRNNLVFSTEDPYGRKRFNAYRASDNEKIRTVQATRPDLASEPTDFGQILSMVRTAGTPKRPRSMLIS